MEPVLIVVLVIVAIAIAIVVAMAQTKAEKDRTASLAALSAKMGWEFSPAKDRNFPGRFPQFEVFKRGHTRSAFNSMNGSMPVWDRACLVQMGDYRYSITTSNGKSTSTRVYKISYIVVIIPFAGVPDVTIRPEGFLDSIAQAIGFQDIDFEDAEFSRMFVVKSPDKRFAYDLCHPRMIEHIKARFARGPSIVISRGAMCFFSEGKRWQPEEFGAKVETVREFLGLWPDHLVRQLGGEPSGAIA